MKAHFLHLTGFSASINDQDLFSDLHLSLSAGSLLHVLGPNGCGKSTFLASITGLSLHPGQAYWEDEQSQKNKINPSQDIFYLSHRRCLKPELTVAENIEHLACLHGNTDRSMASIAEELGLTQQRSQFAKDLSQGQQQRLALAPLILAHKPLWLLDEPSVALDHKAKLWFYHRLQTHLHQQGFVIMACHEALLALETPVHTLNLGESA